jgi:membrane fusion protein, multidrug efflux system
MKRNLSPTIFLLAAAVLAGGCSGGAKKAPAGAPVLVAQAFTTNVPVQIDPPPVGHVVPYSTVSVHSQIGGIISEVHFQQGQEVKKGDMLFTIDPRPSQAALDSARAASQRDSAQLENARIQFEREKKLFDQKLVSQDEYDTSQAAYDALVGTLAADKAAVTNAELNLEFCSIRSPIDGVVGALLFYQGNVVKAPDLRAIRRAGTIFARNPARDARQDFESGSHVSEHGAAVAAGRFDIY